MPNLPNTSSDAKASQLINAKIPDATSKNGSVVAFNTSIPDYAESVNAFTKKELSTRRTLHADVNTRKGANGELFIFIMLKP